MRTLQSLHAVRTFATAFIAILTFSSLVFAAAPPFSLTAAALSNGWDIKQMAVNDTGAVVFTGGDFQGLADGIVFSAPSSFYRIANLGYEPPGTPGMAFVGFPGRYYGDLALNHARDVVFTASLAACEGIDLAACVAAHPRVNALFHYRDFQGNRLALEGDPVPGRDGLVFRTFDRIWLNASGDVAFKSEVSLGAGASELRGGLFLYRQGRIETVAVEGDVSPDVPGIDVGSPKFSLALSDDGTVAFFSPVANAVYRFADGKLTSLLPPGTRTGGDESLRTILDAVPNRSGEVAFHAVTVVSQFGHPTRQAVYILHRDGRIERVIEEGQETPAGGYFTLTMDLINRFGNHLLEPIRLDLKLNDAGTLVFAAPFRQDHNPLAGNTGPAGLFSYSRGVLSAVVADGDPRPDDPGQRFAFFYPVNKYDLNNMGLAVFDSDTRLFASLDGKPAPLVLEGAPAGSFEGTDYSVREIKSFVLSDARAVALQLSLCCGKYVEGIFIAKPRSSVVPNGGFETAAAGNLPAEWPIRWTNFGSGDVAQYNSGGHDSYDWNSTMRLHVGPSGGALFILSDPVAAVPGSTCMLEARMRFYFDDPGNRSFLTVIQYDSAGAVVGVDEVLGFEGDSYWSWVPMRVLYYTAPNAAYVRYRVGLVSSRERYLDVDALQ